MAEKKFTNELKQTFDYIKNTILKEYDCDKISTEYFIISILENEYSVGNKVLSKVMLHDSIENAKVHFYQWLSQNAKSFGGKKEYDDIFEKSIKKAKILATEQKSKTINSGHVLLSIFSNNININKYFRGIGVTIGQINTQVLEETNNIIEEERKLNEEKYINETPVKHIKKPKVKEQVNTVETIVDDSHDMVIRTAISQHTNKLPIGECEKYFINLNDKATSSQIDKIYGNDKIYNEIFSTLAKRNKNNAIIVGKSGVGKTDTVKNLANLIVSGNVPKSFKDKILLEVNFSALSSGTAMRGAFEARMKSIISDARSRGNYIFFMDSISNVLSGNFNGADLETFIESVMKERNIMLICTCSEKGYTKEISDYPEWERYFEKINLEEPNDKDCIEILKYHASKLEYFHNVKYDENMLDVCMKYSKRYITERSLPDSAIDILDKTGAKLSLTEVENDNIKIAREKLFKIKKEKEQLKHSSSRKDYNKIDKLEKEEIELQTILDFAIKSYNLEKQPFIVTENDIKECIAEKTGIELKNMSVDDKEKLKGLNDRIKNIVIGQDEAIDTVCKAIKRQRVGIGNPNKPIVLFFGGTTGVGKTFLCKTLAKELWGDEKQIIRLDMSEYSEQTSVTKLYGAPPSYVGYGDSGSLVDKLKMKKNCILLLDEIEKANEKVYNVFLQLFDEGRLTDSKGNIVDCKNIVVIMTSNIAAQKLINNKPLGFVVNLDDTRKDIIDKELKKHFNPEFLNRIDSIIYFNKLTKKDIKEIILQKIKEIETRVNSIGYFFEKDIKDEDFISYILSMIEDTNDLGARPIEHKLQELMVDKICDKIINNDIKIGEFFKKTDFITT